MAQIEQMVKDTFPIGDRTVGPCKKQCCIGVVAGAGSSLTPRTERSCTRNGSPAFQRHVY